MFQAIWSLLTAGGREELRSLRIDFYYILMMILIIPIIQLITNGWGYITALYAILCIAMIFWRLANINRILSLTGTGELAEFLNLIAKQSGFPPNKLIQWYINFGKGLLAFAFTYFFTIPLINFREWVPAIIFVPFLFAVIALFLGTMGGAFFKFFGGLVVMFWIAFTLVQLLPQIGHYIGLEKLTGQIISAKAARTAEEIERLRKEQRAKMVEKAYSNFLKWQEDNPGKELPAGHDLLLAIEAAKQGLTLTEYKTNLKAEADAKAKAEREAKESQERAEQLARERQAEAIRPQKEAEKKARELSTSSQTLVIVSRSVAAKLSGKWKVEPFDTEIQRESEPQKMPSKGELDMKGKEEFVYFTKPGYMPGEIKITPKN